MPFTVITVKNVPKSLRGDLTKWMQEIATGVYVGNFNKKVREQLWNRVLESIDGGEATISYSYRNEIGYSFNTVNAQRKVVELDGIPLILLPNSDEDKSDLRHGYSDASKRRKAKKFSNSKNNQNINEITQNSYVVLHIFLENDSKKIKNICCFKSVCLEEEIFFASLSNIDEEYIIDEFVCKNCSMDSSITFSDVIKEMLTFMEGFSIVTYGLSEEVELLSKELKKYGYENIYKYKLYDLKKFVKKDNFFMESYDLESVFDEYEIDNIDLNDIMSLTGGIYRLSKKVNKFLGVVNKK